MKGLIFANLNNLINYMISANHIFQVERQKAATYKSFWSKDTGLSQEHPAMTLSNLSKVKKEKTHKHSMYQLTCLKKNANLSLSVTPVWCKQQVKREKKKEESCF